VKLEIAKLPPPPDFRPRDIGIEASHASGYKKLTTPQFSIEYPSTWEVHGDSESNLVALAPKQGIVLGSNGEPAIGLGAVVSYFFADPGRSSLSIATGDLIQRLRTEDPGLHDSGTQKSAEAGKHPALVTQFTSDSPFGGTEVDVLVTVARPEGLFYLIFISPERNWSETQPTFDHMMQSTRFVQPEEVRSSSD